MPSKTTLDALRGDGLSLTTPTKVLAKKSGTLPSSRLDDPDQMVRSRSLPLKTVAGKLSIGGSPKPESPEAPKSYQVIGADQKKTLFTKSEFVNLQKTLGPEGQPLVLVETAANNGHAAKYVLGAKMMSYLTEGKVTKEELLCFDAVLFHSGVAKPSSKVALRSLLEQANGFGLVDALLGINMQSQNDLQVGTRQILVAAMLGTGVIGFVEPKLSEELIKNISQDLRSVSLNAALFNCVPQTDLKMANLLLRWGASANAIHQDDEFSVLGSAIRFLNEPLVELLLKHGADPLHESDTDVSAVELVKWQPYDKLAYLFANLSTAL